MVSRYSQAFQHNLVEQLNTQNNVYMERLASLTSYFANYDVLAVAQAKAQGMLYNILVQQSTLSAYIETFRVWGIVALVCLPLLVLYGRKRKRAKARS